MSYVDTEQSPGELAADAERKATDILYKVGELLRRQADLHGRFSKLQQIDPKSGDLATLSDAMDECVRVIGALGRQRTELLDGMPIIADAKGQIDALTERLANDAKLIDRVKERLRKVTAAIATADKLLGRVATLLA